MAEGDEGVEPHPGGGRTRKRRSPADQSGGGEEAARKRVRGRTPLPIRLIRAPAGSGKTEAAAKHVAEAGATVWLADRHDDVDAAAAKIEKYGGDVGRVLPLRGMTGDDPNCLHPDDIEAWQGAGYNYRAGFCKKACERNGEAANCPFLQSIADLATADIVVATKALARGRDFFFKFGNGRRKTVVLDEDPIGLLRPLVEITRDELRHYLDTLDRLQERFRKNDQAAALQVLAHSRRVADWCWRRIGEQSPCSAPSAADVPATLRPSPAVLPASKQARRRGQKELFHGFYRLMRRDPVGTVRNVYRDLADLTRRAAGKTAFVTDATIFFHLRLSVPRKKRVFVLDATANPALLEPLFAPRPVEVLCDDPIQPQGRVIQLMDSIGPRSYLNKVPKKLVAVINALGDLHAEGTIVLISHRSCVDNLAKASRHADRIKTAYFGALRGRNDLEPRVGQRIACHVVAGSPKTTEEARRQLALAVYGRSILPFADLATVRRPLLGPVPDELADEDGQGRVWEVRAKGYADARMQAVYEHTVTSELTQAADRARVLIHTAARVYLVTNEPCPLLWFAEMCYAGELLDLATRSRSDFEENYEGYEGKAVQLLNVGGWVGNADVCRAMGKKPGAGWRYWQAFRERQGDALEGERKVRWKPGLGDD
jgi:hypothetical protein